jgi:hypothetical protein
MWRGRPNRRGRVARRDVAHALGMPDVNFATTCSMVKLAGF